MVTVRSTLEKYPAGVTFGSLRSTDLGYCLKGRLRDHCCYLPFKDYWQNVGCRIHNV